MLARYLPRYVCITASKSAFFQNTLEKRVFHSTKQQPAKQQSTVWGVAWDLDETLITFNSFYSLQSYVIDKYASIEFVREKMQKKKIHENLKSHPRTVNFQFFFSFCSPMIDTLSLRVDQFVQHDDKA